MAYVYVLQEVPLANESTGPWTKIGYSKNPPEWRLDANLKRGNPRDVIVASAFEFESEEEARSAEKAGHGEFRAHSHQKEWFSVEHSVVTKWYIAYGAKLRTAE